MSESSPAACRLAILDRTDFCFLLTALLNIDSALTLISFAGRDDSDGFFFAIFILRARYLNNQQHSRLCGSNSVPSLFASHDAILAEKASSGHTLGACPFGRHFIEESFILANPGHPSELPYQLQPLEILIRPMRLELDHRPQRLDFECLARPVE